jgi:hypothetical protein
VVGRCSLNRGKGDGSWVVVPGEACGEVPTETACTARRGEGFRGAQARKAIDPACSLYSNMHERYGAQRKWKKKRARCPT